MRGVFIQNGLEYRLEAKGDEFHQGDLLPCTLTAKNRGISANSSPGLVLALACANLNKVKQKAQDPFEGIASATPVPAVQLDPGAETSLSWTFELDKNCTISEKSQSLYLLFGSSADPVPLGQLPVNVKPHHHIPKVLTIFENTFQFVLKGEKTVDGWLHAKLNPPSARKLSLVDELTLGFRFEGESLLLKYLFKVKKFEPTAASLAVSKGKVVVDQRFEPGEYLLSPEYVNHEAIERKVEEAIAVVATGL